MDVGERDVVSSWLKGRRESKPWRALPTGACLPIEGSNCHDREKIFVSTRVPLPVVISFLVYSLGDRRRPRLCLRRGFECTLGLLSRIIFQPDSLSRDLCTFRLRYDESLV